MSQIAINEFADRLSEVMPLLAREFSRRQPDELHRGKVTLPQLLVLDLLSKQGDSKMSDIAHSMHVTTAAMTGVADRLVRDGYALRVYDPQDRRIVRIKLTAEGARLISRINAHRRKMVIDIFGKISEKDRRDYLRVLMQIKQVLGQQLAGAR